MHRHQLLGVVSGLKPEKRLIVSPFKGTKKWGEDERVKIDL